MTLKLYNSLTKKTEDIKPINKDSVSIYSCGPTTYDRAHIGNLSCYIYADTLARTIKASGLKIKHVMNIADIDDKTIKKSRELYPNLDIEEALKKVTLKFEADFKSDILKLNINPDNYQFIRATESIDIIQNLIKELLKNDFAYRADDGIYFSIDDYIKSGKKYGQLVNLDIENQDHSKSRINNDEYDKKTVHDFALWKFKKTQEPYWEFELNGTNYPGRPGWHIECSAMSTSLLNQPFDIHTGGIDLTFPHHENEIAQSTAGKDTNYLAKLFFHNEHLFIEGNKMSKSLNNFYSLEDILRKVKDPLAFRLLILQAHYRSQTDFSETNLKSANNRLTNLRNFAVMRFQLDNS
ncbi:MAG TPA: class I tRNA ligase family protein, partial [Candidatus Saccharimonadia bacterium]|nr:class I tRNA ligase family protein [Candidatus Saccharimonadia bacterium]